MIQRSDESIRLQNEVFMKTTDALQRIESSTGVTEKRIEDIVSGRAGAISERIVDRLLDDKTIRARSRRAIERDVMDSVLEELTSPVDDKDKQQRDDQREKIEFALQDFDKFTNRILVKLADLSATTTLKIGEGHFSGEGDELVDGVFDVDGNRIGVSTFTSDEVLSEEFEYETEFLMYLQVIGTEIAKQHFSDVLIIFDSQLEEGSLFLEVFGSLAEISKDEISNRIHLIEGEPDDVTAKATEILESLHSAA